MDVLFKLFFLFLSLFLIQCSNTKVAAPSSQFIKSGNPECGKQQIQGEYLVFWKSGKVAVETAIDDEAFVKDFIEKKSDEILVAEPHYKIQLESEVPHDLVSRDWGGEINWGMKAIEAESAWDAPADRNEVIVAIVDSGVDKSHPQLQGAFAINENEIMNGIDDDGNGLIDDRYGYDFVNDSGQTTDYTGHGTHIAGIITARGGSVIGAAPNVKLLPLNFINSNGGGTVLSAIQAIRYAAQRNARVINASWGGDICSVALRDEVAALAKQNILFIAAAGNSGNNIRDYPEYPAVFNLSNMITVGANTFDNKTAGFSNFGPPVDLVAPGANIISTYPSEFDGDGEDDGMISLNGTSMATPYVVAAAALLWGKKPDASYAEIKSALLAGVVPGPYYVRTKGALNVRLAMEALLQ